MSHFVVRVDALSANLAMIRQCVVAVLSFQGRQQPLIGYLLRVERLLVARHVHLTTLVRRLAILNERLTLTAEEERVVF